MPVNWPFSGKSIPDGTMLEIQKHGTYYTGRVVDNRFYSDENDTLYIGVLCIENGESKYFDFSMKENGTPGLRGEYTARIIY